MELISINWIHKKTHFFRGKIKINFITDKSREKIQNSKSLSIIDEFEDQEISKINHAVRWMKKIRRLLCEMNNIRHPHLLKLRHSHELPSFMKLRHSLSVSHSSHGTKISDKVFLYLSFKILLKRNNLSNKWQILRHQLKMLAQQVSNENYN